MLSRRGAVGLAVGVVAGAIAALLQVLHATSTHNLFESGGVGGPLYALEAAAQDLALQARRPESYLQVSGSNQVAVQTDPRDVMLIVAIDERTIAELGAYGGGYPRRMHAELVERLLADPPRVIGLDIGFFERTSDDEMLAAALDRARERPVPTRVVLAGVGLLSQGEAPGRAASGDLRFERGLLPVEPLRSRAEIGLSNVVPDERGTIRSMPAVSYIGDTEYPTFGLAVVAGYLRRPRPIDDRPDANTLEIAGRRVPVEGPSIVRINFFGPPSESYASRATFRVVSFVDVLRGRVDAQEWRGKIVLVGASGAAGLADDYWTPVSDSRRKMSGVEIHANVAATLLSTQFLRTAPLPLQTAMLLIVAIVVAGAVARLGVVGATAFTLIIVGGAVGAALWVLYAFGVELPLANVVISGVLAFVGVIAWRVVVEQRQSRALQHALASVIPPSVAVEIARAPERVKLGGDRRTISVLFTDLKGFTSFSESVEPEVLGRIIGEYLGEMSAVVFQHGGTLDKFIGDAVMAFWNAPLDDADHARHACDAALAMQAALAALNTRWLAAGLPCQRMRIGIHTGVASVGNMGTSRRFAYTAVGDTVNLAARLEPLNNEYGTWTCVSQATLDAAGDGLLVRFLDLVAVKGKSEPVAVYELLGYARDAELTERYAPLLEAFAAGVRLYRRQDFEAAVRQFQLAVTSIDGIGDEPSQVYIARCEKLAMSPPAADWNGVYVMEHK